MTHQHHSSVYISQHRFLHVQASLLVNLHRIEFYLVLLLAVVVAASAGAQQSMRLLESQMIWDAAPHNAFTDLVRYKDRWFCVFREGQGHVSPDGALRIITSSDGAHWQSAAVIRSEDSDLRDAKITITPDNKLMLSGAAAMHDKTTKSHQSLAWFSEDGHNWSHQHEIGQHNYWLWRVTWHNGLALGMGYSCRGPDRSVRLYESLDGKNYQMTNASVCDDGVGNESSTVFDGDTAYCLLRRDDAPNEGLLGVALPPYRQWRWQSVGSRVGGPHMILLPDGRLVAAVRLYDGRVRTSLCWIDKQSGTLTEALALPSGGDTSYPGLVLHDNMLWVSYYSTHEGRSKIYLAKVKIE
ncbi:MAG: exo-alpha-sialidase [Pirellulaceae bacterium]|nr:exo-alpha-sialidase [Pirellulaceae bacterium]